MSNCPICQEDLFSSRSATHEMPCGHTIHWHCYQEYSKHDSRCPVCKKTSESPEHMSQTWSAIALSIAMQPVPVELAKVVDIKCNDCERECENLRWHFLGIQCRHCNSFNTSIEKISLTGRQAAMFADQMDAFRSQARLGGMPMSVTNVSEAAPGYLSMNARGLASSRSSAANPASSQNMNDASATMMSDSTSRNIMNRNRNSTVQARQMSSRDADSDSDN